MGKINFKLTTAVFVSFFILTSVVYAENMERIVAIVNGDIITDEELNMFIRAEAEIQGQALSDEKVKELKKDLLERMIEDRLIIQEAKRQQLKADPAVIEDRLRDIKARAGSPQAFEAALKSQGMSLSDLREKLTQQLLIYNLVEKEIRSKIVVSPKEVTEYYEGHESEFATSEALVVDSIFVKDKETLDKVRAELEAGKPFAEVAGLYSQKSNLGEIRRGQLKKELEDFVFALTIGQCSLPYSAEDGFYLFVVQEKVASTQKKLDEVKDYISEKLQADKTRKALKEWIEAMKEKAYISIRES